MRRRWLAVAVFAMGCTPAAAKLRPERDSGAMTETPTCNFTILGRFSHASNIAREVSNRGGDAAIDVTEETGNISATDPKSYSGTVVRYSDPSCKPRGGSRAPVRG